MDTGVAAAAASLARARLGPIGSQRSKGPLGGSLANRFAAGNSYSLGRPRSF